MKMIKLKEKNGFEILRNQLGLTPAQLAAQLNVSRSMVVLVEQNQRTFSTKVLIKLATLAIALQAKQQEHPGSGDPGKHNPSN